MRTNVLTLAVTALAALIAAGAVGAGTTPAAYRAQVNGICTRLAPTFKQLAARYADAQKRNDATATGIALGEIYAFTLREDELILKTPVPAALRSTMAPILARLNVVDARIRSGLARAEAGDLNGMGTDLAAAIQLSAPLMAMFDRAGLRACGSGS